MVNYDTIIDEIYTLIGLQRTSELDVIVIWLAGIVVLMILKTALYMFTSLIIGEKK